MKDSKKKLHFFFFGNNLQRGSKSPQNSSENRYELKKDEIDDGVVFEDSCANSQFQRRRMKKTRGGDRIPETALIYIYIYTYT